MRYPWRALLPVVLLLSWACSDPVSPRGAPSKTRTDVTVLKPNALENGWESGDVPLIPTYYNPGTDYPGTCYTYLRQHGTVALHNDAQTLSWIDQHVPRQEAVSGRIKLYYTWYQLLVNGYTTKCVTYDSVRVVRTAYEFFSLESQPTANYTTSFAWCSDGVSTNRCNNPMPVTPVIDVTVRLPFFRYCGVYYVYVNGANEFYYDHVQPIVLGGHEAPQGGVGFWKVRVDAAGGHTTLNYGGTDYYGNPANNGINGSYSLCDYWNVPAMNPPVYDNRGWEQRAGTAAWGNWGP